MSILSTLNKLTGKQDKNILAALNSLTGKTADDIEEAMGNLSAGGGSDYSDIKPLNITTFINNERVYATYLIGEVAVIGSAPFGENPTIPYIKIPFSPIFANQADRTKIVIEVRIYQKDLPDGVDLTGKQPEAGWAMAPYTGAPQLTRKSGWTYVSSAGGTGYYFRAKIEIPQIDFSKIQSTGQIHITTS